MEGGEGLERKLRGKGGVEETKGGGWGCWVVEEAEEVGGGVGAIGRLF